VTQRLRTGLKALGAVVIGLVLLAVGFLQCGVFRGGASNKWTEFAAPDGSFSVERPFNFRVSTRHDADSGADLVLFHTGGSTVSDASEALGFTYSPTSMGFGVTEGPAREGSAYMWAWTLKSRISTAPGYRELALAPISIAGRDAINFEFEMQENISSKTMLTMNRMVFVVERGQVFMIAAFAPKSEYDSKSATRFISSFALREG
jgi:hypothetical protein